MQVCIHRGTKQIGGSCVEVEHAGCRIVLDFGLPLDGNAEDLALVPRIAPGLSAVLISQQITTTTRYAHLSNDTLLDAVDAAAKATGTDWTAQLAA